MTPERKKPNETSQRFREHVKKSVTYDVVRPGFVLDSTTPLYNMAADPARAYLDTVPLISDVFPKPQDGGSASGQAA